MRQRPEQGLVEQFVTQTVDEGFGEGVLHQFAWRDVTPLDLVVVSPSQDGGRSQLGAVVADDGLWLAASDQKPVELAGHPDAGDRGVGNRRQAFAGALVDHQDAHTAAVDELIGNEVDRPASLAIFGGASAPRCPRLACGHPAGAPSGVPRDRA